MQARWLLGCALVLLGCGSDDAASAPAVTDTGATSPSDATPDAAPDTAVTDAATASLYATRYCEVLVGFVTGGNVRIDVYNTIGLNDCPLDKWAALDATKIKADMKSEVVTLNGPRHWTIDAFEGSSLLDPTEVTFGGLAMRKAGQIDLPLAEALAGNKPYATRTIQRNTTMVYRSGRRVFELVDPTGRVFVMQSWSDQKEVQTEPSLKDLAAKLTPATGWSFRVRTLDADLRLTAPGGLATVVQDDLTDTYFLSP